MTINIPEQNASTNEPKKEFESLLPYDKIKWEEKEEAFEALHWALKDSEINNIAITGYFGSGKSSFWESYRKQVLEKK